MPPRPGHLLSILPLALGLGGCVADGADSGLTILNMVPAEAGCTFTAGGQTIITSGTIEASAPGGYLAAPEIRNNLTTVEGEGVSGKTIFLHGARVEIDFYDDELFTAAERETMDGEGVTRFQAPFGASVEPNGGLAVVAFEIVPAELVRAVGERLGDPDARAVLDVRVRAIGTRGGSDVESNVFRYPVEVCHGCLTHDLGRCAFLSSTVPVRTGGFCQLGQDRVIDCCADDHDDLEVPCPPETSPPPGMACDDGIDQPEVLRCPARPLEL